MRRALSPSRQSTTLSSMAFWRSPRTWFQRLHTPRDRYRLTVQAVRNRCIGGAALRSPSLYAMVRWREIADFIPIGISGLRARDIKRIQSHDFYGSLTDWSRPSDSAINPSRIVFSSLFFSRFFSDDMCPYVDICPYKCSRIPIYGNG